MNKKKTLIIVIASALVVIIGIVAVVLALRGKDKNEVVDATTTTESADVTTESTSEEYATPSNGTDSNEESGEGKTESLNENSDKQTGADKEGDKETDKETKEDVEIDGDDEKVTIPDIEPSMDGTLAPTVAPTEPITVAPTEPPTQAPTVAPTEPPTEAPTQKPLTEKDKFLNCGGTYVANPDGTVTVNYANVKGDVVIPNTIDGKKVVVEYTDLWGNTSITSLYIDTEVIPELAFCYCDGLVSVVLGPNVKTVGDNAFADCDNLEKVTFMGEGITDIPAGFVSSCPKITSLTLPRSVKRVELGSIQTYTTYVTKAYPFLNTFDPEYDTYAAAVVPAFTIYTYSEPGEIEVYDDNWFSTMKCPETLEEMLEYMRRYNYSVVYLD